MKNKQNRYLDKSKPQTHWDDAIAKAEHMIAEASIHLAELKQALRVFKQRKADGVPFPGSQLQVD